jgi:pilus retraction protein PilT
MATAMLTPLASELHLADGLSREYLLHHRVCPSRVAEDGSLVVAVAPDALLDALDDIGYAYRCQVAAQQVTADEVHRLIERLTTRAERLIELQRVDGADGDGDDGLTTDVRDLANEPPVVRYVNLLVRDAYDAGASDIHLEAMRSGLSARFRLDGVLSVAPEPPAELQQAVISRIKLLAELDIAERRRPQDGRIRVRLEQRELDLRVSTVPTMFGESLVLRLLDRGGRPVELDELGMPPDVLATAARLASRPHGMLLVTGPTGSGKTTTLYAALQRREAAAEKIITVEDPVEYQLAGITQVPVHRQAGVTFGSALRSILRQDPDVIMIGEIRDLVTIETALNAAETGHLVVSTMHTLDAVETVNRAIGFFPLHQQQQVRAMLAGTLRGIISQRLVPRADGSGRIPAVEVLVTTGRARDMILDPDQTGRLHEVIRDGEFYGMQTFDQSLFGHVKAGLVSVEDAMRTASSPHDFKLMLDAGAARRQVTA